MSSGGQNLMPLFIQLAAADFCQFLVTFLGPLWNYLCCLPVPCSEPTRKKRLGVIKWGDGMRESPLQIEKVTSHATDFHVHHCRSLQKGPNWHCSTLHFKGPEWRPKPLEQRWLVCYEIFVTIVIQLLHSWFEVILVLTDLTYIMKSRC